jgi:Protein of unknown function (DUF2970)
MSAHTHPAKVSFLRTVKTVAWSFIGIRKNSEYKQDLQQANPFHIIAVGLAGTLLLVAGLMVLVHWIA